MDKKLTFKIKKGGKETVNPRWRACETENTNCPLCHNFIEANNINVTKHPTEIERLEGKQNGEKETD